jgi:hypothetical protein
MPTFWLQNEHNLILIDKKKNDSSLMEFIL